MKFKAIGRNILLKMDSAPEKIGTIIVAGLTQTTPLVGTVVSVGHKVKWVKAGDKVRVNNDYGLTPIDEENQLCVCVQSSIACIITE